MGKLIASLIALVVIVGGIFWIYIYMTSDVVPPGTTVILLHARKPAEIKQEGLYHAWGRTKKYFVDTKLKAYAIEMDILCADDINMTTRVKWVGSFYVTDSSLDVIKKKVKPIKVDRGDIKGYQLSLDSFFKETMQSILESISRSVVSKYRTENIRQNRKNIREEIKQMFISRMQELKYPVETTDVLITNLDYPGEITDKRNDIKKAELKDVENAAIAKANVSMQRRNAEIKAEQGKAKLVESNAKAAANKVRASSLTPRVLRYKKLEMLKRFATADDNMVVVIPFDTSKLKSMGDAGETLQESLKRNIEVMDQHAPREDIGETEERVGESASVQ